ncbi:hypothetical protein Cantr_09669 [Candida viswanathii]|uniref:Uncharacterized protein n=1 Tax=Candida viswanathii TaxID=5486 RepID=A0A367YBT1_9ASCO|nr:hypothetical protein Cantr_09669 [Candida viswanathii]
MDPTIHQELSDECGTLLTLRKFLRPLNVLSNLRACDIANTEQLGELGGVIIKIGQMAHTGFSFKHDLPQSLALWYRWLTSLSRIIDLGKEIPHVRNATEGRSLEAVLEDDGTGEIEYGRYSSSTIQLLSEPKTHQFLYIPPASLSSSVSDKKVQEYITAMNIKGARWPVFFVTLESWREFKKVLPLIFCVLVETPAFNKVNTRPFRKEIMYQGDLVKSPDDVIVNTFNKSGIKSECDNVLLRFNMYKGAVSANMGKNIPGVICEHIWNTYVDHFKKHGSKLSDGVDFGSVLLHEVVRWHIKRCNLVRDELDALRQEVNEYCDAFEKEMNEVDERGG